MSSSSPAPRSSRPGARLSPFYRDLATPISSHHRAGAAASAAAAHAADAASAAPWRGGFGGAGPPPPPPPPLFTLDDRVDFSPDPAFGELPPSSPRSRTPPRPDRRSFSRSPSLSSPSSSSSALRIRAEASSSSGVGDGATRGAAQSSGRSSWMTPERGSGVNYLEKGKGSPVEGVVEPGALIALPTNVKEVALARQDSERASVPNGGLDDEEWITVFGFYPSDTNLILREFEKCGVILRHLPGPSNSNWIHILYEHRYDARKALEKNGTQLTSALIIGVKSVDQIEWQLLNERLDKLNRGSFMVSLPSKPFVKTTSSSSQLGSFPRPYHPKSNTNVISDRGRRATGSIASPAKSLVSKVADLVFGL